MFVPLPNVFYCMGYLGGQFLTIAPATVLVPPPKTVHEVRFVIE